MTEADNPFDGAANRLMLERNATEQDARDLVVLQYLLEGDTRALAHWLERDYCPGKEVRRYLSFMLQPVRSDKNDPSLESIIRRDLVPYALESKRRDGRQGRPRDRVSEERDRALRELYDVKKTEIGPGGSDSTVLEMAALLEPEIKKSAIREALKSRSRKK